MLAATQQPPTINTKALSWTIGVHLLLLLLFFFLRYGVTPSPSPADLSNGLEVNLGNSDNGSGNDQPQSKEDPAPYSATVLYKNAAAKSHLPKDMLRSNDPNDPSLNNPNNAKKNALAGTDSNTAHVQQVPKFVYHGETGKGGNGAQQNSAGTSEGKTTGPGDQGVKGGTVGATNYTGTPGNGTGGIQSPFADRSVSPAKFVAAFHEGGTVIIHVTVDRKGNIVGKYVKQFSSQELKKIALDKLSEVKFSPGTGSEPEQQGDVTIVFKAR